MSDLLKYKDYYGSVAYSAEDHCLVGKVEFIDDLILFDGTTLEALEAAFHDAVDSYLAFCAERGQEPCTTYKGSFNVRIGSELHRQAALAARKRDQTLNEFVKAAIEQMIGNDAAAPARASGAGQSAGSAPALPASALTAGVRKLAASVL